MHLPPIATAKVLGRDLKSKLTDLKLHVRIRNVLTEFSIVPYVPSAQQPPRLNLSLTLPKNIAWFNPSSTPCSNAAIKASSLFCDSTNRSFRDQETDWKQKVMERNSNWDTLMTIPWNSRYSSSFLKKLCGFTGRLKFSRHSLGRFSLLEP